MTDRGLNLFVGESPRFNFDFALVLECIDLLEELFSGLFFSFVHLVRTESLCDLELHLLELDTALLHYLTSHLFVVVFEFSDAFQLLDVGIDLVLVCLLENFPS